MKNRLFGFLFFVSFLCSCCSGVPDATKEELAAAKEAGSKAAEVALAFPKGSMEREGAIIAIRARETALRDAGFLSCADSFAVAAERVLEPAFKQ